MKWDTEKWHSSGSQFETELFLLLVLIITPIWNCSFFPSLTFPLGCGSSRNFYCFLFEETYKCEKYAGFIFSYNIITKLWPRVLVPASWSFPSLKILIGKAVAFQWFSNRVLKYSVMLFFFFLKSKYYSWYRLSWTFLYHVKVSLIWSLCSDFWYVKGPFPLSSDLAYGKKNKLSFNPWFFCVCVCAYVFVMLCCMYLRNIIGSTIMYSAFGQEMTWGGGLH